MRGFLVILASVALAHAMPTQDEQVGVSESLLTAINECVEGELSLCLKEKAWKYTERIGSAKELDLYDGVSLVSTGKARSARSYEPLSTDPKARESEIDSRLIDNVGDFLDSHVLQFRLPGASSSDESRALEEEGRGKKKKKLKKLLPLLLILKLKLAALIPLFLGIIAFAAFKALLLGKIAFFFSSIQTIQKLLKAKSGGGGGWSSGGTSSWASAPVSSSGGPYPAAHHEESHGWDSSSQGWGRKNSVDGQSLAYSGYNNQSS